MKKIDRFKSLVMRLTDLISQDQSLATASSFSVRHADQFASACFGYESNHAYRTALEKYEQCRGYYAPDRIMLTERMSQLGYSLEYVHRVEQYFLQALCNDEDVSCRAIYFDEPSRYSYASPNNYDMMLQDLIYDLNREDGTVQTLFKDHSIFDLDDHNFYYEFSGPKDFPNPSYFNKAINIPFIVRYDLDQGADEEAIHYRRFRQLTFKGNARFSPNGIRGWGFPTVKIDREPMIDHRTQSELRGEFPPLYNNCLDDKDYAAGEDVAMLGDSIPANRLSNLSWLAGYLSMIKCKDDTLTVFGEMSVGRADSAFYIALGNAQYLSIPDAFHVASETCRHLASNRCAPLLEETISRELALTQD